MKQTTFLVLIFLICPSIVAMDKKQKCDSCHSRLNTALKALEARNFEVVIGQISLAQKDMEELPQMCLTNAQSKSDYINGRLLQEAKQDEAAKDYFNRVLSNQSAPEDIRKSTLSRLTQIQIQH